MNRLQKFLLSCVAVSAAMVWLCATPCPAVAQEEDDDRRLVILVFGISLDGISLPPSVVDRMNDYLATTIVVSGRYIVVPRGLVDSAVAELKSDGRQLKDTLLASKAGEKLAADRIAMAYINKSGSTCQLKVDISDVEMAMDVGSDVVVLASCSETAIMTGIRQMVSRKDSIFLKDPEVVVFSRSALSGPIAVAIADFRLDGIELSPAAIDRLDSRLMSVIASNPTYHVVRDDAAGKEGTVTEVARPVLQSTHGDHSACTVGPAQSNKVEKLLQPRIVKIGSQCSVVIDVFDIATQCLEDSVMTDPSGCSEADIMSGIESVRGRLSPTDPGKGK